MEEGNGAVEVPGKEAKGSLEGGRKGTVAVPGLERKRSRGETKTGAVGVCGKGGRASLEGSESRASAFFCRHGRGS